MERLYKTCRSCNRPFSIGPEEQVWFLDHGLELPAYCSTCRTTQELRVCTVCGQRFTITLKHLVWFKDRGLKPFTKCQACRTHIREQRQKEA